MVCGFIQFIVQDLQVVTCGFRYRKPFLCFMLDQCFLTKCLASFKGNRSRCSMVNGCHRCASAHGDGFASTVHARNQRTFRGAKREVTFNHFLRTQSDLQWSRNSHGNGHHTDHLFAVFFVCIPNHFVLRLEHQEINSQFFFYTLASFIYASRSI